MQKHETKDKKNCKMSETVMEAENITTDLYSDEEHLEEKTAKIEVVDVVHMDDNDEMKNQYHLEATDVDFFVDSINALKNVTVS